MTPLPPDLNPVTRIGAFMQTYMGRQFWPIDPRPEEVDIRDIAHALSMACRYSGHCLRFYSVAEHSVLIAYWLRKQGAAPDVQLWGLMHDASEAYLTDVIRPIKPSLTNYYGLEENLMRVITARFGMAPDMPAAVKEADNRILSDERAQNMRLPGTPDSGWPCLEPLGAKLPFWSPEQAEWHFLDSFHRLAETTPEALAVWRAERGEALAE